MERESSESTPQFAFTSRLLHWVMAPMVVLQLFIAAVMMASLAYRPLLLAIHEPLGIAILVFVVIRMVNRILHRPPPFLSTMGPLERLVARGSEYLLYALLLVQPLVGWAMLSAAGTPIVLFGQLQLPSLMPHDAGLFATLRQAHAVLAYLLFATFTAHMCAVLMHTLVLRDGLLSRMAPWPSHKQEVETMDETTDEPRATADQSSL